MKFGGSFSICNPDSSQYVSVYGKVCCHCGISNSWLASPVITVSTLPPASDWPQASLQSFLLGVPQRCHCSTVLVYRIPLASIMQTDVRLCTWRGSSCFRHSYQNNTIHNQNWSTVDKQKPLKNTRSTYQPVSPSLTFDGAHYVTVYRGALVHWKQYWASWSAIADKANTAGHLMDSVQTLPCHKMILTLQMKSPRRDGVTHKDMWVSERELWKCNRLGHLSCDFLCLDTRSLCLYTSSKNTIRHKTPGWSTDVIKCH